MEHLLLISCHVNTLDWEQASVLLPVIVKGTRACAKAASR